MFPTPTAPAPSGNVSVRVFPCRVALDGGIGNLRGCGTGTEVDTEDLFHFSSASQSLFPALLAQRAGSIQGWESGRKGVRVGNADLRSPACRHAVGSSLTFASRFSLGRGDQTVPAGDISVSRLSMGNLRTGASCPIYPALPPCSF